MKNRSGSYKKILIDSDGLKAHGDLLRQGLSDLKKLDLSPPDFATLYLLLFLRIKHPKNWLQKKSRSANALLKNNILSQNLIDIIPECFDLNQWEQEKIIGLSGYDLFKNFNLKAIPESINRTMLHWYEGSWKIEMLEHIPTPRELLRLQVKNTRCTTVITNVSEIDSLVFNSRDPLSFMLHDLMHADQFFSQNESLKGQLGFYQLISDIYDQPRLRHLLKSNEEFKREFEYVASDMNAYVIHLFKCLKSSISRTAENEIFFSELLDWWQMNDAEKLSSHLLNSPQFNIENEMILKNFFESKQEIYR